MNKPYTSEFETIMNQYLQVHPEVIEEQQRYWRSFWEVEVNTNSSYPGKEDIAPDDQYGFRWHQQYPH